MKYAVALAIAVGMVVTAGIGRAADIGVAAKKLVIVGKVVPPNKAKAVFIAKDAAITKGSGTDPTQISATLDVSYDSVSGQWLAPAGASWQLNSATIAKYKNSTAPTGGSVKTTQIRPAKLAKLLAKSFGDTPIDISAPPTGPVLAVYTVTNGAETNRHCASFSVCKHKVTGGGTGYNLSCKNGTPAACAVGPTTTSSSTTTTSASTTTTTESTTSTTESTTSTTESTTSTTESTTSTTESTTSTTESTTTTSSSSTTTSSSSTTTTSSSTTTTSSSTTTTSSSSTTTTSSSTTTTTSSTTTTTNPLVGPAVPPDGGTVTVTPTGGSAGAPGGAGVSFTGFAPTTSWSELYWGPSSAALPAAGLDATLHTLSFSGISGTTVTWAGLTSWTNPTTGTTHTNVPIEARVTITGLGGTPWVLSTSIPQLDPGVGTGIGAVVNNVGLANFSFNTQFVADIPTDGAGNFIAINTVQNAGNATRSSFTGGFYSRIP